MMITIHGFPAKTKYQDVKILVKQECNINDFILDNLVNDQDGTKKVRIGLTDNSEGYRLMKCLDGYRMAGNFVLKAVPVGKAAATLSQPAPFETQPSYQNQPRSDYSNAPRNDYIRPTNEYSDQGPHGGPHSHAAQVHGGPHGVAGPHSSGQHGVRASHIQSVPHGSGHQGGVDPMGRPSPWATASSNQNQWSSNAPVAAQVPQNTYSYNSTQAVNPGFGHQHQGHPRPEMRAGFNQGRGPDQGYGFPAKSNIPEGPPRQVETRSALRSIETVDTSVTNPPIHSRYPASQPYQDKPVLIMKDNFQGPTQYNINNPGGQSGSHSGTHSGPGGHQSQYPQAAPMPWESQSQQPKSFSKPSPTPYEKQYDDRKYPQPEREVKIQPFKPDPQDRTYKDYEKRGFSPRRSPHRRVTPERRVSPSLRRISPSGRRISPSGRKFSPSGRKFSPSGRRISPSGRRISPSGRRISPSGRRISPSGRRISPSGRRISPSGRRISPSGRRISPSGRRISPSGRRISPSGRRISPSGRRVSPHARKFSPPVKRVSPDRRIPGHPAMHPARRESPPHKRLSPGRRLVSPPRRPSPGRRESPTRMNRYSPERHHSEKLDKYGQDKVKQIRPAYEPTAHASNQAMYSGGYRQEPRDVQYPMQGMRQAEQRANPWQRDREDPAGPMKKQDDDRREMARMQIGRDRNPEAVVDSKRTLTPQRKSRSPVRRDRSPLRDRYKRNSPSPRSSHSPRRSWALEKRRSPEIRDAPPPPSWPGQNVRDNDYPRTSRPNFPERDQSENTKRAPVWERPFEKDEDPRARRPDNSERRPFADEKIRPTKEIQIPARQPAPHMQGERIVQREPKFTSREDYEAERRDNYRRREPSPERKPHPQREDYEPPRRAREHEERPHPDEYHRRREPSPRHEVRKEEPMSSNIDKDFEDIYKKALMFRKKAEELRRIGSKRREDFDTEDERSRSHHGEREREDAPRAQRYEDRHRFREEEMHRPRERDDRPRHDDRPDDIQRRQDYRPRDDYKQADHDRDRERVVERPKRVTLSPASKAKREKAVEDICKKIVERHEMLRQLKGEQRNRVLDELQLSIARIVADMFGSNDVSFIEIIIKYQAKYNMKDEEKILQDVMAALPSPFRIIKRDAPEMSEVPAKIAKRSPSPNLKPDKRVALSPKRQRPQASLRRKPAPKVDPPVKSEPKPSSNDAKTSKGPAKVKTAVPESTATRKPEVKKPEEDKKEVLPARVPQEGHYELNARMTKMVERELQDIMIKLWQELPDNPTDETEAVVVDKLRNKAGDDLRNVLGLNITKRLLNVHNPLYVKVQFSGKPEKVHLGEFLKKYNFNAFKRIEQTVNMFAAQVKTINDFDRLCSAKDIRCGDIKVFVNPIYKFTKCPQNLVTSFYDKEEDTSDEASEVVDKGNAKTEENKSPEKAKPSEKVPEKAEPNKTETVNKPAESKIVVNKPASEIKPENKAAVNKTIVENKAIANKPAENKAVPNNTAVNKSPQKPAAQNKNVVNKPAEVKTTVANNATSNKPVVGNATSNKPAVGNVTSNKPAAVNKSNDTKASAEIKEVKKPQPNTKINDTEKKAAPTPTKNEKTGPKPKEKDFDDNDELDDHDILALMSEGIILDECSGSDEE
nr:serine/arginine repetitive matrix protein 2 isoform X4 [Helicoverpa armigera]